MEGIGYFRIKLNSKVVLHVPSDDGNCGDEILVVVMTLNAVNTFSVLVISYSCADYAGSDDYDW